MTMPAQPYRLAIAGLGTVGLGLIELLETKAALITTRTGRPFEIIGITARNRNKDRGLDLSAYPWVDDAADLPTLDGIDAVVELIGGDSGPALTLARKTLAAGKDFVTANKALLALHGAKLAELAEANNCAIAYEAAVAGAIPAIKVLREALAGNAITKVAGILNGTCNYILSTMEREGAAYADVLKQAQELGYAEADPTTDVDGFDAAHKLTLLAALAFGQLPDFAACQVSGIQGVSKRALAYAARLGLRIRLIALATPGDAASHMQVAAMALPSDSLLGTTFGSYNAVQILADQAEEIFLKGPGAGRSQTASAVAGDLIDLACGHARPVFGAPLAKLRSPRPAPAVQVGQNEARLCILQVKDEPGIMAALTQVLAVHEVSVDQLMQPGGHDGVSDLALITYPTAPANVARALAALTEQDFLLSPLESYRIEQLET